jgi:secreted Zn-dependent insulinase-like peptidase
LEYKLHTFSNGLRLAFKQTQNTQVAHCGFFINAGSRDELPNQVGLAHLLEHMAWASSFVFMIKMEFPLMERFLIGLLIIRSKDLKVTTGKSLR